MAASYHPHFIGKPLYPTGAPNRRNRRTYATVPTGSPYSRPSRADAAPEAQHNPSTGPHDAPAPPPQDFLPGVLQRYAPQRQDPLIQPTISPTAPQNPDPSITIVIDNATEVTGNHNFLFLPATFVRPEIVGNNTVNMVTAALKNLPATKDRGIDIGVMGGIKVNGNHNFVSAASDLSEAEKVAAMMRATGAGSHVSPVVPEVRKENEQGGNGEVSATRPAELSGGPQQAARPARRSSEPPQATQQDPLHRFYSQRYRKGDSYAQYGQFIPQPPPSPVLGPACVPQEATTLVHMSPGHIGLNALWKRQDRGRVTTNDEDVPVHQGVKRGLETNSDIELEKVSKANKKRACIVKWVQETGEIKGYQFF